MTKIIIIPKPPGDDYDFSKDIDIDVDVDLNFDTDIDLDKDVDIDVDVDSNVHLDGNFASATFTVEAVGDDTLAEVDINVLAVEGELSSVDGVMIAAAA